jgi:hypothetical protein
LVKRVRVKLPLSGRRGIEEPDHGHRRLCALKSGQTQQG